MLPQIIDLSHLVLSKQVLTCYRITIAETDNSLIYATSINQRLSA